MLTDKKISVVLPCHNEEVNILPMYERLLLVLQKITPQFEIIFADNNSTDNSPSILRQLAQKDQRVAVVYFARNFGDADHGYSAGTEIASGDAVVWIDCDFQDPPEMIEQFVAKWLQGYQVVYGIRIKRQANFLMRLGYKFFYRVFNKMSYLDIPKDAGDFCLIDHQVAEVLNSMPERDRFVRGLRAWAGFKQTGIEYVRPERLAGQTSVNIFDYIKVSKRAIMSFSYAPLELISQLGLLVTVLALVAIVVYFVLALIYPDSPKGIPTVIILILFLGGIQLLALSVIGDYLGRIFEEVKQRPKYVIKEILNQPAKKR